VNGGMSSLAVHLIRLILAILIAWLISRLFFPGVSVLKVIVLAAVLLGLAYLFEYTRKRDRGGGNGS
jgi:ABC-type sulfate transport system permease component